MKPVDLLAPATLTDAHGQTAALSHSQLLTSDDNLAVAAAAPHAEPSLQASLDHFLLWSLEIFDAQAPHERGVRFLSSRAVVELGGVPKCFLGAGGFGNAACRYANRIYARSQADRLLGMLSFSDLCERERTGQMEQLPSILANFENELLERCYGDAASRRRTALALKRSISLAAWELALRIAWRRYGPTLLIVLSTGVAFAVAVFVWLRESGLNLLPLLEEWWFFILDMMRGH